ncbi:MAG: hypothetical protein J4473_01095 [Candidatus Aenigmarchaeota archaeon]|nr:hypothetical protein [Candidatus Aenigmarchaeota archaeon]
MERKTIILFSVIGALIGYISALINNPPISALLAIIIVVVLYIGIKSIMKIKQDWKWWIGNGIFTYFVVWFVVWTIFYNLRLFG